MTPPRSPPLFEITPANRAYHSGGTISLKRTCRQLLLAELPGGKLTFQVLPTNSRILPTAIVSNKALPLHNPPTAADTAIDGALDLTV